MRTALPQASWRLLVAGSLFSWGTVLLSGVPAGAEDRLIAGSTTGECTLRVEAAASGPALRLRVSPAGAGPCRVESGKVLEVLDRAFAALDRTEPGRKFTSLAIGRLIDYPWMARFLAESAAKDNRWDADAGKPKGVHENRYVADILARPEIVGPMEAVTRPHGYRVVGVSVEKVLIGGFDSVPGWEGPRRRGKVPFDAQTWFRLETDP